MSKLPPPPPPSNQPGSSKPRQQRQLRRGMPGKSQKNGASPTGKDKPSMPRWAVWALIAVAAALIVGPRFIPTSTATKFTYTEFLEAVSNGQVTSVKINNLSMLRSGRRPSPSARHFPKITHCSPGLSLRQSARSPTSCPVMTWSLSSGLPCFVIIPLFRENISRPGPACCT